MSLRSKLLIENPEDPMEYPRRYPLRITLLSLGVIAVLSNWMTVSVLGSRGPSVSGFEILGGQLFFLVIVGILVTEFFVGADEYRRPAWLYGGAALALLSVGSAIYIRIQIARAVSEAGIFAGAFDASLGFGVWLAILVSVGALYIGYSMEEPEPESEPESESESESDPGTTAVEQPDTVTPTDHD